MKYIIVSFFDEIYKDLSDLSFFVLYLIRNHLRRYMFIYTDYNKYDDNYKRLLLEELRISINNTDFIKNIVENNSYCCKIIHNKIFNEEPLLKM